MRRSVVAMLVPLLATGSPEGQAASRPDPRVGRLILADNGSDWYFQGTRDGHWRMVRPNSGRADRP